MRTRLEERLPELKAINSLGIGDYTFAKIKHWRRRTGASAVLARFRLQPHDRCGST